MWLAWVWWLVGAALVDAALFPPNSPIVALTSKNFDKEVKNTAKPALVAFTAPWCGHCKNLAPQYTRVAQELDGVVTIAYVDCEDAGSRALCSEYGIQGFPTIKLFPATKRRLPRDYTGERKAKAMLDYALDALPAEAVRKLDAAGLAEFVGRAGDAKVVLVTPLTRTSPMLRALALDFHPRVPFALVNAHKSGALDAAKAALDDTLTEDKLPALYFVDGEGADTSAALYRGAMRYRYIKEWIEEKLKMDEALERKAQREARRAAHSSTAAAAAETSASTTKRAAPRASGTQRAAPPPPGWTEEQVEKIEQLSAQFGGADAPTPEEEAAAKKRKELDRKKVEALLRARERIKKEEGIDTPPGHEPQTKQMLMEQLGEHLGNKWGLRIAEHADRSRKAMEAHLISDPTDTKGAMDRAETDMVRALTADIHDINTQLQAGADEDGYPLSEDAEEALVLHRNTLEGLVHTIELRLEARKTGKTNQQIADELAKRLHDEL